MDFYVYILYSDSADAYYKGQTTDLHDRKHRHNNEYEKATKKGAPWTLIWCTQKQTRSEALLLEKKLKNLSREKTIRFIEKYAEESRALTLKLGLRSGC
ncbi:GIY-YIG nuclease family protein [Maribellus sediminis]|uniref:GIY-YIG nuclease family protein n=1 Tax=Maribellus sediminis TaxID=2696285 RepID=UPI00142FBA34